jgi:hypothetical protein
MVLRTILWLGWNFLIEYIILYNIDKMTKGFVSSFIYRYFEACENPPDAWYMNPSWHKGNLNEKVIFAFNKCPAGFSTNNAMGLFCKRNDEYEMTMCQEANLYRLYNGENIIGDLKQKAFNQNSQEYLKLKKNNKITALNRYKDTIKLHDKSCVQMMEDKTVLLKTICLNKKNKSGESKDDLQSICYNMYCKDKKEAFCHQFEEGNINLVDSTKPVGKQIEIIAYILVLIILMILIVNKLK